MKPNSKSKPKKGKAIRKRLPIKRRLGIWRYLKTNGTPKKCYISLGGDIIKSHAKRQYEMDTIDLKKMGLEFSGENSSLEYCFYALSPYRTDWVSDFQSLRYWYLPKSVIEKYNANGIVQLHKWQADCLTLALGCQDPVSMDLVLMEKEICFDEIDSQLPSFGKNNHSTHHKLQSLVFSSPTSGGKSLVAEVIMARGALFNGLTSFLVLPHIALCEEKLKYLESIFGVESVGLRIESFHSNKRIESEESIQWNSSIDIAICTIEKANSLFNKFISELTDEIFLRKNQPNKTKHKFISDILSIGVLVIDELHLIGDTHRGYLIEVLLSKILKLKDLLKRMSISFELPIKIIGLSATFSNLVEVSKWIDAKCYISEKRCTTLNYYYTIDNKVFKMDPNGSVQLDRIINSHHFFYMDNSFIKKKRIYDPSSIGYLVWECFCQNKQCIVFCPTREWCMKSCDYLCKILPIYSQCKPNDILNNQSEVYSQISMTESMKSSRMDIVNSLKKIYRNNNTSSILLKSLLYGIGYHHSGMSIQERSLVESAFRSGHISVICATSTLSLGVNLPAHRVILRSTQIGKFFLDSRTLQQMVGRAGRTGFSSEGEGFIICSSQEDSEKVVNLLSHKSEPVQSVLYDLRFIKYILELVCLKLVTTIDDIRSTILEHTFLSLQYSYSDKIKWSEFKQRIDKIILQNIIYLVEHGLIVVSHIPNHHFKTSMDFIQLPLPNTTSENTLSFLMYSWEDFRVFMHQLLFTPFVLFHFFHSKNQSFNYFKRRFPFEYRLFYQFVSTGTDKMNFIQSYLHYQSKTLNHSSETLDSDILYMINENVYSTDAVQSSISQDLFWSESKCFGTPLGYGFIESSLPIFEGLETIAFLYSIRSHGLFTQNTLHLAMIIIPVSMELDSEEYLKFAQSIFSSLDDESKIIAEYYNIQHIHLVRNHPKFISHMDLHSLVFQKNIYISDFLEYQTQQLTLRFMSAVILNHILKKKSYHWICQNFSINLKYISTLKTRSIMVAAQLSILCEILCWDDLSWILKKLKNQLESI